MNENTPTSSDYPFHVDGGGSPSMFTGFTLTGVILKGGLTAHHGTIVGVPCRLVEDPTSPLRFGAIGELRYTKASVKGLDATERWVVLAADEDVLRATASLYGKQVRIEYPSTVVTK